MENEKKLSALRERLHEINEIVGLDSIDELKAGVRAGADAETVKLMKEKLEVMKKYYDEMIEIKKEIAKLEGRKSIFEDLD